MSDEILDSLDRESDNSNIRKPFFDLLELFIAGGYLVFIIVITSVICSEGFALQNLLIGLPIIYISCFFVFYIFKCRKFRLGEHKNDSPLLLKASHFVSLIVASLLIFALSLLIYNFLRKELDINNLEWSFLFLMFSFLMLGVFQLYYTTMILKNI